jgi:hypothetical protein
MRGDSNERLTILTETEKTALYNIPNFDDFQRVEFFAMTEAERSLALQRRGLLKRTRSGGITCTRNHLKLQNKVSIYN